MAFYSGSSGYLMYEGTKAAKVQNWRFSSSLAVLDATTLGDRDRTSVAGIRQLTGSCRLFYYDYKSGSTAKNDASALINKAIKTAGEASEVVQFALGFVDENGQDKTITFDAFITAASMSLAVGEVLAADITFQATGAIEELSL